jgi:hypothetical protein
MNWGIVIIAIVVAIAWSWFCLRQAIDRNQHNVRRLDGTLDSLGNYESQHSVTMLGLLLSLIAGLLAITVITIIVHLILANL